MSEKSTYEKLRDEVRRLQAEGRLPTWPTDQQRIDWAFGNTAIENKDVTRDMAARAVAEKPASRR